METASKEFTAWSIKWYRPAKPKEAVALLGPHLVAGHRVPDLLSGSRAALFRTRELARSFVKEHYGYIKHRPDLQRAPHWWKMPQVVKVKVTVTECTTTNQPEGQ